MARTRIKQHDVVHHNRNYLVVDFDNYHHYLDNQKETKRKALHLFFVLLGVITVLLFGLLILWKSPYLGWDYSDPETAVFGAAFHAAEYLFVRLAPLCLAGEAAGAWLTRGNRR